MSGRPPRGGPVRRVLANTGLLLGGRTANAVLGLAYMALAARSLGASGWQLFWRVTVPNLRWGLLYGVILCNARAMGEFGAIYVVSGHIAGRTDTMPLRVEKLILESKMPAAFAVSSMVGSRPSACRSCFETLRSFDIVSIMWTGMRMVRA